eukprot:TRINITY_DN44853_c0_g1_i2.p1 TRINITY_DN44853_c0_g1~~TRINITY_DN44853_c0_g1_i2.p1  ORF type:complete len:365 (+),score=78.54 TRINITY_DN44853_c0_g1_i2:136-1230(+)
MCIRDRVAHGFSVWLDAEDIPAGCDWHGAIGKGLSNCKAIVSVVTNKYLGSRFCVNELYTADSDMKLIFPIIFEDVNFEACESAQGVKFVISGTNWTMCRPGMDDYEESLQKLLLALRKEGLGKVVEDPAAAECACVDSTLPGQPSDSAPAHTARSPGKAVGTVGYSSKPFKVIAVVHPEAIVTFDGGFAVTKMPDEVEIYNSSYEKVVTLGGGDSGIEPGEFITVGGVAVDAEQNLIVASHFFIQRFSTGGGYIERFGGITPADQGPQAPKGIALGANGHLYVCEQQNKRVKVYNSKFEFDSYICEADPILGNGQLSLPQGVAEHPNGDLYVADFTNNAVFDPDRKFKFRFSGQDMGLSLIHI